MKVLIRELAARLQRLSPLTITVIGVCCVLALGVVDRFTPGPDEFRPVPHARRAVCGVGRREVARRCLFQAWL